jgi:hypothetical protein
MASEGAITIVLWSECNKDFGKPSLCFAYPTAANRSPNYRAWPNKWRQLCATPFARHMLGVARIDFIEIERITGIALAEQETDHSILFRKINKTSALIGA